MPSDAEVYIRTLNTKTFMDAEPLDVAFSRRPLVSDGSGGKVRGTAVVLAVQRIRLVAANTQLPIRQSADGREVQPVFSLVAMPDLDVVNGDTFSYGGVRYEVLFVYPARVDATRADVGYGR
jgi:hypothetical protein